jgi:hypothetical protein
MKLARLLASGMGAAPPCPAHGVAEPQLDLPEVAVEELVHAAVRTDVEVPASSATELESTYTATCAPAVTSSTARPSATVLRPSRERRIERSTSPCDC